MATFEEIDRRFTRDFNTAVELLQQDEFEKCTEALRNLLADSDIPRYHRIKCHTMLAGILDDFHEAYVSYVKGETLWRLSKAWFRIFPTPALKEALDDLHGGLEEIREALVNDEERPEDTPVPDVETDVLRTLEYNYYARVEEDHEIEEAERETWSEDEMSNENMGGEEEVSDRETKVENEQKLGDKEESEAQKVSEEETAAPDQEPKDKMVLPYRPAYIR